MKNHELEIDPTDELDDEALESVAGGMERRRRPVKRSGSDLKSPSRVSQTRIPKTPTPTRRTETRDLRQPTSRTRRYSR